MYYIFYIWLLFASNNFHILISSQLYSYIFYNLMIYLALFKSYCLMLLFVSKIFPFVSIIYLIQKLSKFCIVTLFHNEKMKFRALCSDVEKNIRFWQKSLPFLKMDILKMSKIDFPFYFLEQKNEEK